MLIVKIMNRYIFIGLLCFVIGACTHHTTGFYEGPRYLSFVNEKGADTAFISFANYPGASTHEVAFDLRSTYILALNIRHHFGVLIATAQIVTPDRPDLPIVQEKLHEIEVVLRLRMEVEPDAGLHPCPGRRTGKHVVRLLQIDRSVVRILAAGREALLDGCNGIGFAHAELYAEEFVGADSAFGVLWLVD